MGVPGDIKSNSTDLHLTGKGHTGKGHTGKGHQTFMSAIVLSILTNSLENS